MFILYVFLQKKKEQMLLFQFPDLLPTKVFEEEESDCKVKARLHKTGLISNRVRCVLNEYFEPQQ